MEIKSIQKRRNIINKHLIVVTIIFFSMFGRINQLTAEIREGVVVDKRPNYTDMEVYLKVDAKRPYDHIIRLVSVDLPNYPGMGLDMIVDKGTTITFDDEGMSPRGAVKYGDQRRIIYVDGMSVLEMFPDRQNAFPYAQQYEKSHNQSNGTNKKPNILYVNQTQTFLSIRRKYHQESI
jgi:hypothetical protein